MVRRGGPLPALLLEVEAACHGILDTWRHPTDHAGHRLTSPSPARYPDARRPILVSDSSAPSCPTHLFVELTGGDTETGLRRALLDGHPVAASAQASARCWWTTYLRVGQIEVAEAAIKAGGAPSSRPVPIGAVARTSSRSTAELLRLEAGACPERPSTSPAGYMEQALLDGPLRSSSGFRSSREPSSARGGPEPTPWTTPSLAGSRTWPREIPRGWPRSATSSPPLANGARPRRDPRPGPLGEPLRCAPSSAAPRGGLARSSSPTWTDRPPPGSDSPSTPSPSAPRAGSRVRPRARGSGLLGGPSRTSGRGGWLRHGTRRHDHRGAWPRRATTTGSAWTLYLATDEHLRPRSSSTRPSRPLGPRWSTWHHGDGTPRPTGLCWPRSNARQAFTPSIGYRRIGSRPSRRNTS